MVKDSKDKEDEYRFAFEIISEKARVRVYEPIITKEERDRRMAELKKATQDFWEDYYRRKAIRERDEARARRST